MTRRANVADELSTIRRLLRDVRRGIGVAKRDRAIVKVVRLALFRLPARQREIVRRYDLEGQPAPRVQADLAISRRQLFRDRRAALSLLHVQVFGERGVTEIPRVSEKAAVVGGEVQSATRALALTLCQSGSGRGFQLLHELSVEARNAAERAHLLLDLAEAAFECSVAGLATESAERAAPLVDQLSTSHSAQYECVSGRFAAVQARLAPTLAKATENSDRSIWLLQQAHSADPSDTEIQLWLADAIAGRALIQISCGRFAEARQATAEACALIHGLEPLRPAMLQIFAMRATLSASASGEPTDSMRSLRALFTQALEAGWHCLAGRLAADIVGLHNVHEDYNGALRFYRKIATFPFDGSRAIDRFAITGEAAHAYITTGRPAEGLALLREVAPDTGVPERERPTWHLAVGKALEQLGHTKIALREANEAMDGFIAQGTDRGTAAAHHLLARCHAHLKHRRASREHIDQAYELTAKYGTPYALFRVLGAKARIFGNAALAEEARELAAALHASGRFVSV